MRSKLTFLAFCTFEGSVWLLGDSSLPPAISLAVFGLACLVVSGAMLMTCSRLSQNRNAEVWPLVVGGVAVIGLPAALTAWAQEHLSGTTTVAAWSLLPLVVAGQSFFRHSNAGSGDDGSSFAWALCGLGGELLLLPVSVPSALAGRIALLLLIAGIVLCGTALPSAFSSLREDTTWARLAVLGSSAGVFSLAVSVIWSGSMTSLVQAGLTTVRWPAVLAAAVEAILLLVFLRSTTPTVYSTRVFLAPAISALEGAMVFRVGLSLRMAFGLLLLLLASFVLWRQDRPQVTKPISLRA